MSNRINIAIDGFSSCGKSTIAKQLAASLGYIYIDTGAMYRGVTLFSMREGLWRGDEPMVEEIVERIEEVHLSFARVNGIQHLFLNGEDVEHEIRGMEVSNRVSPIATIPGVRKHLVAQQKAFAADKGVVMDGRDIGTVVMPDAELKIFVTASPEVRAQRRYDELRAKGDDTITYDEVLDNLTTRDRIDSTRDTDPLKMAEDAVLLDNSELTLEEQQQKVMDMVGERLKAARDI